MHIKENLEHADALIVFHELAAISLSASLPILKNKIYIIPQGVASLEGREDREMVRAKYGIKQDETVFFLMVAGLRPVKNIPFALKVFCEVKKQVPEVVLLHLGSVMDKEEAKQILALSENLSVFDRSAGSAAT